MMVKGSQILTLFVFGIILASVASISISKRSTTTDETVEENEVDVEVDEGQEEDDEEGPYVRVGSTAFQQVQHLIGFKNNWRSVDDDGTELHEDDDNDATDDEDEDNDDDTSDRNVQQHGLDALACRVQSCPKSEYRSIDGTCNNEHRPQWGAANTPFKRLLSRKHSVVECGKTSSLPNPRLASRQLVRRSEADPSSTHSLMVMVFGQLLDHDIQLTPMRQTASGQFLDCCDLINHNHPNCCPIIIPSGDPFYGRHGSPNCIHFSRSALVQPTGADCGQLPDVENANTAWIDLSLVYGSTEERARNLRSNDGKGQMEVSIDRQKGKQFPPINITDGFSMEFGDPRGDEQPTLMLLHTIFLRYHNKLADGLAQLNPHWSDEKIYQEARKINSGIFAHIVYTEFLDALLGVHNDVRTDDHALFEDTYDSNVDGSSSMVFATAAYRLHTFVSGSFQLLDNDYNLKGTLRLRDVYHKPLTLLENDTFEELMRCLAGQSLQEFNNVYTEDMTEFLFPEEKHAHGADIISLNIQRARDHQIQGYTSYKRLCGLGHVHFWKDMQDLIPEELVHRLFHIYHRPEDVELYIAGTMETPLSGSLVGPTMHCLIRRQFKAMRDGDRYFYTRPGIFHREQLQEIKKINLASVLCENSNDPDAMNLPRNVFTKMHFHTNPPVHCRHHHKFSLQHWRH